MNPTRFERVRAGNWNPDNDENDRQNRNALAARGYWQAFQHVQKSLEPILAGENSAQRKERANSDRERCIGAAVALELTCRKCPKALILFRSGDGIPPRTAARLMMPTPRVPGGRF